ATNPPMSLAYLHLHQKNSFHVPFRPVKPIFSKRPIGSLAWTVKNTATTLVSVGQSKIEECRDLCVNAAGQIVVKVMEALAGDQRGHAHGEDDVVAQERAVLDAETEIDADEVGDIVREGEYLQRLRAIEPEKIGVSDQADFRRDVEIDAGIGEVETGVDEVTLSLDLARLQVRQQALAAGEIDAEQPNRLSLPVAELAAGEIGIVENRIEAGGVSVARVLIAGSPEERGAETNPVSIIGKLNRGHLRED